MLELQHLASRTGRATRPTRELEAALRAREVAECETVRRLARLAELRDPPTGGHAERIGPLAERLADLAGLSEERCRAISTASVLHDIGKVVIPDAILHKPAALTAEERAVIERHPVVGHDVLKGSASPLLETAATIAYTHHERHDGSGYPRGLRGDEIPLEGRIVAIVDVYDALTSDRSYRPRFSEDEAIQMMGRDLPQFDPWLFGLFEQSLGFSASEMN
jgi:putative two-component system response regulator